MHRTDLIIFPHALSQNVQDRLQRMSIGATMYLKMGVLPLLSWLSSPPSEVGAAEGPGLLTPENFWENYT